MLAKIAIAYAAGLLSFFAPCGTFLLPGFFAYSFKTRRDFLAATCWFLAGFMTLFMPVGLGLHFLAIPLTIYRPQLVWAGGIVFIMLGGLALSGRGLHIPVPRLPAPLAGRKDVLSAYLLGLIFGFTVAGCTAPLLALSLAFATMSRNVMIACAVLTAYAVGLATPLFILAFAADRSAALRARVFRGKTWQFRFAGKERMLHSTNLLSAIVLCTLGAVFIASQGTFYVFHASGSSLFVEFNVNMANFLSRFAH